MTEDSFIKQRDGYVEYPKVIYPNNAVEKPVVVKSEEEWLQYKAKGWSEKPFEMTYIGQLKINIDYHEKEYIRLRQELAEIESAPELVEEPKPVFVEVPFGGKVPVLVEQETQPTETPKVEEAVVETIPVELSVKASPPADEPKKPNPFVSKRVKKA